MCSTQADNNSQKLGLRCGCQFPWSALALAGLLKHFSYKYVADISRRKHYQTEKEA
jgi:hypothetical protein